MTTTKEPTIAVMGRRCKSLPQMQPKLQRAAGEDQPAQIVGYAAVFYNGTPATEYELWEDYRERIMPGAFDAALAGKQDVRALFNHDSDHVLGRTVSGTLALRTDAVGLLYEITPPPTQLAKDLAEVIGRGDVSGSSFSFIPRKITWVEEDRVTIRQIDVCDLYDVGPVTFPAYDSTTAGLRDSHDAAEAKAALESYLAERSAKAAGQVSQALAEYSARARLVETVERLAD